ncbi:hypothetical protein [Arthrobacter sp. zg-Y1110]|nr:hypothetical protein [Arthrobacter sp. zg-Y1110]MCC3292623.1 hypothetical protein [Arthrobacter sp. zg-Y1110]UWX86946.1 hypothetical protein N2K99_16470 [Arthrobacter sp. zg-Y1110]
MVKVSGVIRPLEKREISAEAEAYTEARQALLEQLPEGWELIQVMTL